MFPYTVNVFSNTHTHLCKYVEHPLNISEETAG